jgi:hypothetical protein
MRSPKSVREVESNMTKKEKAAHLELSRLHMRIEKLVKDGKLSIEEGDDCVDIINAIFPAHAKFVKPSFLKANNLPIGR